MNEQRKTPTAAGATNGDATKAKFYSLDSTTGVERKQGFVESFLPHGEENAISTAELVRVTGYRSARQLQSEIESERAAGALILSVSRGKGGYFLPTDGERGRAEIARFERTVKSRALNSLRTLKAARQALQTMPRQKVDG